MMSGAVDYLQGLDAVSSSGVGVIGFCMGGGLALVLGAQRPDAVAAIAPYYGLIPWPEAQPDWSQISARVQGHFAEEDGFFGPDLPPLRIRAEAVLGAGSIPGQTIGAGGGTGTCSVTLSQASRVTATFVRTHNTLTVSRSGTGTGGVASSPAGINCGTVCTVPVTVETTVSLTPTPAAGSRFTGWAGACSGTGACEVSMGAARTVIATFTRNTYALDLARDGTGGGSVTSAPAGINCGATCRFVFNSLTVVKLTAKPVAGSAFAGWTGACSGSSLTCSVTMNEAASVGATFSLTHYALSVTRNGTSTGTVTSTPAGINCGTTCSKLMPLGSAVRM